MHKILTLAALPGLLIAACAPHGGPVPTVAATRTMVIPSTVMPSPSLPASEPTSEQTPVLEAPSFPDTRGYVWALVSSGYESPVDIQFPPDGSGRMFIVEQAGRLRVAASSGL